MNEDAADLWSRALRALRTAEGWIEEDPDASASRAYYAAFYAVSAFLALSGQTFSRHTAVQAAVHRDLVRTGRLSPEIGIAYSALVELRKTGDYGGSHAHVNASEAREAVAKASLIVQAVRQACHEPLP